MKITNETYKHCSHCGVEANGLDSINKIFGYKIVRDEISPYSFCRECRKQMEEPKVEKSLWATASNWGKRINISRRKFDNYLVDLGYLDCIDFSEGKKGNLDVTEKGKYHSAITNTPFRKYILWDYEVFSEVVKMRTERAMVYECCPRCKSHLDSMPGYNHLDFSHRCHLCGMDCDEWIVDVVYDK